MEKNNLDNLRHSCAHLLAAAVLEYYPKAKLTLGPSIESGFYYDIDLGELKIAESDFSKLEQKMHQLVKKWEKFERTEVDSNSALKIFNGNEYKEELIKGIVDKKEKITIYKSGEFSDLCRGGHVDNPKENLKYFKLLSIAGAYWRGDEKNKMLTRIYGTVFPTKEELDAHLKMLEEAKKRDHRKLGKELDLFVISENIGKGLPLITPKGNIIRKQILDYEYELERRSGFQQVFTPHIARSEMYKKTGHWQHYRDVMYAPFGIDGEEYVLKPMNCPHHYMIYASRPRSYKDLPMRLSEPGTCYRFEKTGELAGLLRVRAL
ncbi:MAG: threonine--tRNA ligase, partial [Candidatus Roizmanbacteria bacterium]|nr:threonine--tRNA ligase [Candidatus Roizmanbacteria bacterium]